MCELSTGMNSGVPCMWDGGLPVSSLQEGASSAATAPARTQGNLHATRRPALQASRATTTSRDSHSIRTNAVFTQNCPPYVIQILQHVYLQVLYLVYVYTWTARNTNLWHPLNLLLKRCTVPEYLTININIKDDSSSKL